MDGDPNASICRGKGVKYFSNLQQFFVELEIKSFGKGAATLNPYQIK